MAGPARGGANMLPRGKNPTGSSVPSRSAFELIVGDDEALLRVIGDYPGDSATLNSYQPRDATRAGAKFL
jgi:hypothetical protein